MPLRIDAYMTSGMAAGWLRGAAHSRPVLESGEPLELERATWQSLPDLASSSADSLVLDPDDVVAVVDDDETSLPVHAAWHAVILEAGPYRITGELPTLPGFDPGRALTRPSGEFVLLRDLSLELSGRPELGTVHAGHGLVNRYAVEQVEADIMLGFYFPGAAMVGEPLLGGPALGSPEVEAHQAGGPVVASGTA